jgi:hypothetical protein
MAGLAVSVGQAYQAKQANPNAPALTMGNLAPGVLIAALGAAAADAQKTSPK